MTPVSHGDKTAHIYDQVSLAKGGATFRDPGASAPSSLKFFHHGVDRFRGKKLPLLHVDGTTGLGSRQKEIGLATKKSRDLQDIHDPARLPCLFR